MESTLGQGSTFRYTVPIEQTPDQKLGIRTQVIAPGAPSCQVSPLRILAAEDSADNRMLLQAYMKGSPHTVTFVEDGAAAVEIYPRAQFDLILMDLQMPRMDGLAATERIRAIEAQRSLPRVPILALSANARPEDVQFSCKAGCDGHLSKPISKARLLAAIQKYAKYAKPALTPGSAGGIPRPVAEGAGPIPVQIPEGLEEIAGRYLESRRQEAPVLAELLGSREFDRIRVLAHNMKGTGAPYGLTVLTQLGAAMEIAAKDCDEASLSAQIAKLAEYLARVEMRPKQATTPTLN